MAAVTTVATVTAVTAAATAAVTIIANTNLRNSKHALNNLF